ncbi:MAG: trans-sialidase [Thaumarchaeota archaeon]|nr:trans-sialidase [Nitrososphaerota archaeon]
MAGTTKSTKKDLEAKIAELEEKLAKLATQFESKPKATTAPPPPAPKPQVQTPPPAPKPTPPPQVQTPPPAPKPQAPAEEIVAVYDQWKSAPTSDFHTYRAKVTGYSPAGNRYFASKHVKSASVPYHPRTKYFAGYGIQSTATGSAQTQTAPPPPAPKPKGTLPAGTKPAETSSGNNVSRKEQLEAYEKEYLARMQQQHEARTAPPPPPQPSGSTRGSLPAGFKPTPPPAPAPAKPKGTLPKGF